MQYPIPQFIEEEGKIIFFLTFRQFFLLLGGGGFCLFLYYLLPFWLFAVLAVPSILIVLAVAFIKIDNETIVTVLLHFLGYSVANKNYVWKKGDALYSNMRQDASQLGKVHKVKKIIETKKI